MPQIGCIEYGFTKWNNTVSAAKNYSKFQKIWPKMVMNSNLERYSSSYEKKFRQQYSFSLYVCVSVCARATVNVWQM